MSNFKCKTKTHLGILRLGVSSREAEKTKDGEREDKDHCWLKSGESWEKLLLFCLAADEAVPHGAGVGILGLGPLQVEWSCGLTTELE